MDGPYTQRGAGSSLYILNANAEVVVRSALSRINDDDISQMDLRERQESFTNKIKSLIGNFQHASIQRSDQVTGDIDDIYRDLFELNAYDEDELKHQVIDKDKIDITRPDAEYIQMNDTPDVEIDGKLINLTVPISRAGELIQGTVKRRKCDGDTGFLLGKANSNPLLDTRVYDVEMPDGTYAGYYANSLIESIYNSADDNNHTELFLDDIIDHQANDNAIPKKGGWVRLTNGASKCSRARSDTMELIK